MRQNGYTLIELMVVIVIMSLIFGIGFASFRDFNRRQGVDTAYRDVIGAIRTAQAESAAGNKNSCTGQLDGYEFKIVSTAPARFEINVICDGNDVQTIINETLADEISFGNVPSDRTILFKILAGGTDLNSGSTYSFDIGSSVASYTKSVSIRSTGEVK